MMPIRFHDEVEADLDEAWNRIARDSVSAADRLIDAVASTVSEIARHPHVGWQRPWKHHKLRGIRSWRVTGFTNYLIFYRIEGDAIAIVAVLHGAQLIERVLAKR
jgi:toxin ParE1/3/4